MFSQGWNSGKWQHDQDVIEWVCIQAGHKFEDIRPKQAWNRGGASWSKQFKDGVVRGTLQGIEGGRSCESSIALRSRCKRTGCFTRSATQCTLSTHLTNRLASMSHFLFPIKGSGDSSLRPFSAQKKIETAVMNSVRRSCWKRSLFYTHWMETVVHGAEWNDEKLQVRHVELIRLHILVYCMELRWRQPCSDSVAPCC